ncbi:MAG TPA: efflux RND transporter periplasmic adaptor subunit [Candidatus Acidoferrum sp.]|nr:efflux RND transporter periplasmic adaptor subunit [Candidatus Acidoferrum sp.]
MNAPPSQHRFKKFSAIFLLALLAAGCHRGPAGGFKMPPPLVNVITVQPQQLPITTELPGRIDSERIAQVNARVDGIVLHRYFEQGSTVTNGQVLYQIDPAPYQATVDSDRANLMQAQQLADRYKPLVSINAVSKQNYDNAVAAAAEAKAALEIAEINLGYCAVTAPITGRVGAALVTEGALVSQSAATQMALIQQMDPIYFDFTEPSVEVLKLQKELAAGELKQLPSGEPKVTLQLPDGTAYPHEGKLLFQDITVDPSSGMVTVRAEFPNSDGWLLPGMFVVGNLEQAIAPETILVPQPSVVIEPDGSASVMLVTETNSVMPQPIQLGAAVGTKWVVQSGLKAGDRVIVAGLQKAMPGMPVTPVPVDENSKTPAAQ